MSKLKKFKSRFKRFVLVLPVIVCLVFSFVPLCVNAETSGRPPYFPDLNDSISWAGGENYLIFQGIQTSGNATYACSYVFYFNGDNGYYSISENDTSYTLSYNYSDGRPTSRPMLFCYYIWGINDTNEWYLKNESLQSYPDKCKSFTFDYSTNKLTVTESDGDINTISDCLIYTDIKEFNPNALNVDVSFSPALIGEVDRSFVNNGKTYYDKSFEMTVTNNSSQSIQYRMGIFEGEHSSFPSFNTNTCYGSGLKFLYLSKEWLYSNDISNMKTPDLYSTNLLQLHAVQWHYLAPGESTVQLFNWSQIDLQQSSNYSVVVEASLTPYSYASNNILYDDDNPNRFDDTDVTSDKWSSVKALKFDSFATVYNSSFSVKYLGDVTYDPSDTSNGIIANNSYDDFNREYYQRDASVDSEGTTDFSSVDVYNDPASWLNSPDDYLHNYQEDRNPNISSDTSFFSLIGGISNVYDFLRYSLSILPSEVYMIILSSIFVVIFIGIIKRLG